MASNIIDIRTVRPTENTLYLLDSNVWLCILHPFYLDDSKKIYVNFFKDIRRSVLKPKPRIVLPAMLLSEVVNRIIRDIYFKEFQKDFTTHLKPGSDSKNFKEVYRRHPKYKIDYEFLCHEIKVHHSNVDFVSDEFNSYTFKDILKSPPIGLDFNDMIYAKMSEKRNYCIVTHDIDFNIPNVPVITGNHQLLKLAL